MSAHMQQSDNMFYGDNVAAATGARRGNEPVLRAYIMRLLAEDTAGRQMSDEVECYASTRRYITPRGRYEMRAYGVTARRHISKV